MLRKTGLHACLLILNRNPVMFSLMTETSLISQVAGALDRKERLLSQLRSMNDEAEKTGPDGQKMQPTDSFRHAYADVVMQLKQVGPVVQQIKLRSCIPYSRMP